jgi:hypothetical protein
MGQATTLAGKGLFIKSKGLARLMQTPMNFGVYCRQHQRGGNKWVLLMGQNCNRVLIKLDRVSAPQDINPLEFGILLQFQYSAQAWKKYIYIETHTHKHTIGFK